jgi:hypothetical protein
MVSDSRCQIRPADASDADAVADLAAELAQSFPLSRTSFHLSYQALLAADDAVLLLAVDGQERLGYLLGFQHLTVYVNGPVAWVDETPGCRAHFAAMADPRAHAGLPG